MTRIVFYRQTRYDGGVRTGVTVDGDSVLHLFEEGDDEVDPAIVWLVDIIFEGTQLPSESDDVRRWLVQAKPQVRRALQAAAEKLEVGVDKDVFPSEHVTKTPEGVRITIRCSAIRRVEGLEIARYLAALGRAWTRIVRSLSAMELA